MARDKTKRLGDIRLSYHHIERQREIFVIRGQVVDVWECSNGKSAIQETFRHRHIYIRGEAATFIPHSRETFIPNQRAARPRG